MNSLDALRKMVEHYPGGRAVISQRLGVTDEVMRKQLSGAASHKHGLIDAVQISDMCIEAKSEHCFAFINSIAARSGGFIRLPVVEMTGPVNLQRSMSDVIREMSDVSIATIEGDADGVISDNDLARSLKEIEDARTALQIHEMHLMRKNAAGKPVLRAA